MNTNTCIIIAGPTAAGKTALAIQLASFFKTSIISADSRQCFKEMNIGVAKPSADELNRVRHYFINSHSIQDEVNAAVFEQYALEAAGEIFDNNPVCIMVGGTGMYIRAFCEGLDQIPSASPEIRASIQESFSQLGLSWLQNEVKKADPLYFDTGEQLNPQRLMRALEVKLYTGQSIREFQKGVKAERPFKMLKIGLALPKEVLQQRIDKRLGNMLKAGLEEEARQLYPLRQQNALQTVGYREWVGFFEGLYGRDEAIAQIRKNTRLYAKRQMTWFRKDPQINWFDDPESPEIPRYLSQEWRRRLEL